MTRTRFLPARSLFRAANVPRNRALNDRRRACRLTLGGLALGLFCASFASGQDTAGASSANRNSPDGAERVAAAYSAAREAKTREQYQAIATECEALTQLPLGETKSKEVKKLAGWANYRLGTTYLDEANSVAPATDTGPEEDSAWLGLLDQATDAFRKAEAFDPSLWQASLQLGVCEALRGHFELAVPFFDQVIKQTDSSAKAFFNRAECHAQLGHHETAFDDYSAALKIRSQDAQAYTGRGHVLMELGKVTEAIEDYKRAVQLAPHDACAYINRGDAYQAKGEWSKAIADYREAQRMDSDIPAVYQRAAWLMATCPDPIYRNEPTAYERAMEAIDRAGRADALLLDTLAAAQAANGWFEDAALTLSRAKEIDPDGFRAEYEERARMYSANRAFVQPSLRR